MVKLMAARAAAEPDDLAKRTMNYRRETLEARRGRQSAIQAARAEASRKIAEARLERDAEIERVRAEARNAIAEARAARDAEIRRLAAAEPALTTKAIADRVGSSKDHVIELLDPERREAYSLRRREYWRARAAERLAAQRTAA
jgi:F0F1-type ATP synthase membrane subunit b/b'